MKNTKRILCALLCVIFAVAIVGAVSIFAAEEETIEPGSKGEIQVWLIAGQSNAVGYGEEVPEDGRIDSRFTEGFENVIAYGRLAASSRDEILQEFEGVKVGMGKDSKSTGAELGIASALGNSGENHAVIKYAVGGTKLHPFNGTTWTSPSYIEAVQNDDDPTNDINSKWTKVGDYYEEFMKTLTDGLALLVADGYTPIIRGLWWMQGEAETTLDADWAPEYEKLLTYLVDDMRADIAEIAGDPSINDSENPMPFVIGKINRNPNNTEAAQQEKVDIVNAAQQAVAAKRARVSVVDAHNAYKYYQYDSWHYNTETQMYLGEQFVAEVLKYENKHLVYADGRYALINTGMYTAGESVTVEFKSVEGYEINSVTMQIGNGEAVAVELTDGKYVIDSMPAANVRFVINASADDVITEYGTIPGAYFDAKDYPYAIFNSNGEFVGADNKFTTGAVAQAAATGDGAVILVRRDVDMSKGEANGASNLSNLNGTLTVDLGGNVISMGTTSAGFDGLIKAEAHKLGYVTNVVMKNGTILLGEDPIVRFSGANDEERTSAEYVAGYASNPQKFTITFDGLTIGRDPRHSDNTNTLVYTHENLTGNHPNLADNTLIVKDCDIDLSGATAATLFRTGNIAVKFELLGGSIKASDPSVIKWVEGPYTTLNCGVGTDGEYTKLVTSADAAYRKVSFKSLDGKSMGFDYVSTEGDSKTYQLALGTVSAYGLIPEQWASASSYPWVVFDTNGKCVLGTALWSHLTNPSATSVASNTGDGSVVLLRANYKMSSKSNATNAQASMSRHNGTITIDLNQYSVTVDTSMDAFIKGEANKLGYTTNIVMKNGKVVIANTKSLVRFSAAGGNENRTNAAYLEGCADNPQTFNITLENLDISVASSVSTPATGMLLNASIASAEGLKFNTNFIIKDCDVDYGTATPAKLFNTVTVSIKPKVTLIGSTIKANDLSSFTYTASPNVTFGVSQNEDAKYVQLIVGNENAIPAATPNDINYSAVKDLAYKLIGTDDGYNIYELQSPTLTTPYGTINAKYYSATTYPWVVFDKDGKCVSGTKLFTTTAAAAACEAGDGAVIYLRRDTNFDTDKQSGGTQSMTKIDGTINIDLNNFTITMGNGGNADALIRCEAFASGYTTNIIVKNGKIVAGVDPLVRFSAINTRWPEGYDTNTDPAKVHNFYVTFEGLDISVDESADMQGSYVIMFGAPTPGYSIKLTNNNVTVKNCNIDLTNSVKTTHIFGSPSTIRANGYLVGGSITFGDNKPSVSGIFGETFYVDKNESGNYTVFNYAKGDSAHTTEFKTVDGAKVVLAKISENAETSVYSFVDASAKSYSPKMSITLANAFIMNVYVPVANTQKFTFGGVTYENLDPNGENVITLSDGNAYYLVALPLGSSEAAKEVKLTASVDLGNSIANATFTFSIPKYAAKLLADDDATETEQTLVMDVLVYVKEAYNYVGFAEDNSAEEIARVNALIDSIIGDYVGTPTESGANADNNGGVVTAVTLNLDSTPSIRFYTTNTSLALYANGRKLNTVSGTDSNGTYVELDVYAYALAETITFGDGGSYHISSFAHGAGENEKALANAFVKYVESAAAYRNEVIGK